MATDLFSCVYACAFAGFLGKEEVVEEGGGGGRKGKEEYLFIFDSFIKLSMYMYI